MPTIPAKIARFSIDLKDAQGKLLDITSLPEKPLPGYMLLKSAIPGRLIAIPDDSEPGAQPPSVPVGTATGEVALSVEMKDGDIHLTHVPR